MSRRRRRAVIEESSDDDDDAGVQYSQLQQRNGVYGDESAGDGDAKGSADAERVPSEDDDQKALAEENMSDGDIIADEKSYFENLSQGRGGRAFDETELKEKANAVMKHILLCNSKREPARTSQIKKLVPTQGRRITIAQVMKLVESKFKKLFGYKLVKLPPKGGAGAKSSSAPAYVLKNANYKNPDAVEQLNMMAEAELPKQGLLLVIYSLILLKKGPISDSELRGTQGCLARLNGVETRDLDNQLKTLVKQMYLEKVKMESDPGGDESASEGYAIGRRGRVELNEVKIFEFMHEVIRKEHKQVELNAFQRSHKQQQELLTQASQAASSSRRGRPPTRANGQAAASSSRASKRRRRGNGPTE